MRKSRNKGSPSCGEWWARWACALSLMGCAVGGLAAGGCKANPTELRGKTSFGPEFQNRGNNTSQVRYDTRQAFEVKWDNGWTTAASYRRRDVDEGSGDNENRVMVEVGYPLWKAPKKEDKTAQQIEDLQKQVEDMRARVAALKGTPGAESETRVARVSDEADRKQE